MQAGDNVSRVLGVLAAAAVLVGCGDDISSSSTTVSSVTSETTAVTVPATTTAAEPPPTFVFEDQVAGTTASLEITNLTVETDVTGAPPVGLTQLFVSFDYTVRTTTPGRQAQVIFPISIRVPAGCGEWWTPFPDVGCTTLVHYLGPTGPSPGRSDQRPFRRQNRRTWRRIPHGHAHTGDRPGR